MNKLFNFFFAFLLIGVLFPNKPVYGQDKIIVGSEQEDFAHSLKMYQGNYYIIGTTRVDAHSAKDYYLLKLRSNGLIEKQTIFEIPKHDVASQVVVDDQGIFICGSAYDKGFPNVDMHLVKLGEDGSADWEKFYGTSSQDQGFNFIRTSDGGFALIGYSNTGSDYGDMYFVKTDDSGELIWEKFFGPRFLDYGFSLVENQQGEFILAGTENGFYNPTQTDFLTHDADILIVKTDNKGDEIWYRTFGGDAHDWAKDIITAPDGGYLICGSTQSFGSGSFDIFLMKIDDAGNELWKKTFGGTEFEYGEKLQLGADGNIYISGTSASFSDNGKPDNFIVKTDPFGELIWSKVLGGNGSDYASGLISTPDSGIVFTGWTSTGEIGRNDITFYKLSKNGDTQTISSILPFDSIINVVIYPNPAIQKFTVEIIAPKIESYEFLLFDMNGTEVIRQQIVSNQKVNFQPQTGSGSYIYRIQKEERLVYSGKIIYRNQ